MPTYGTTDRCTGGTASANSAGGGYEAAKAFDDNTGTRWMNTNEIPTWIKYDFGAGISWKISKLTLSAFMSDNLQCKAFTLQGSNNDSDWTTVYTGQMANSDGVQTFTFINKNSYRYFKVNVTTTWHQSVNNNVSFWEIQMFEGIYPGGGFLLFMT